MKTLKRLSLWYLKIRLDNITNEIFFIKKALDKLEKAEKQITIAIAKIEL